MKLRQARKVYHDDLWWLRGSGCRNCRLGTVDRAKVVIERHAHRRRISATMVAITSVREQRRDRARLEAQQDTLELTDTPDA
jgi:hypothetical protein